MQNAAIFVLFCRYPLPSL